MAEWGANAVETFFRINLLIYCTDLLKISPATAGLIVGIGVVWDGFTDPIVGRISDRMTSRFGRRIPLLLLGIALLPLTILAMFYISADSESRVIELTIAYLFANTALTLISVPHAALAGDLSKDSNTRTQIFATRYFYTILGLLTGIVLPGYFLQAEGNSILSYQKATWGIASVIVISGLFSCFVGRQFDVVRDETHRPQANWMTSIKQVTQNKPFVILVFAYLAATIGQSINSSLALYYYRYRLKLEEDNIQLILLGFTVIISISLPVWYKLAERFDKITLLSVSIFLLALLGGVGYPILPEGNPWPIFAIAAIGGILVGSVFLLEVILANLVDGEDAESGEYGTYFGLWKLSAKIARAAAIGLSGVMLGYIGFDTGTDTPSSDAVYNLGLLFGPGVSIFFVLGALLVLALPRQKIQ